MRLENVEAFGVLGSDFGIGGNHKCIFKDVGSLRMNKYSKNDKNK